MSGGTALARRPPAVDDLAARLLAGDERAAAELYHRHWGVVVDVVCRRLGSLEEAEAVAQEALIRALDVARREPLGSFRAYAMRVALNLATDLQRGAHWRAARGRVEPDGLAGEPPEDGIDFERLRAALDRLSPEQRQLVRLRYEDDASFRDIAETLRMSRNGVFERHARVLAALRAWLGGGRR